VAAAREKWTRLEQRIIVKLQVMYQCLVMQLCDGLINYNTSQPCLVVPQLVTSKPVSIHMKYVVKQCKI